MTICNGTYVSLSIASSTESLLGISVSVELSTDGFTGESFKVCVVVV